MTPIPSWIDREAWDEYIAQRARDKKAVSPRSAKMLLAQLYEFRQKGHDVTTIIDEAINGHWLKFYEPKEQAISDKRPQADSTAQYLAARAAIKPTAPPSQVLDLVRKIRGAA